MKWKTYRLGNILQFNPAERLAKGTFAKKVPMDLLQPRTRAISGFEMVSYTGGNKFRNGDTLMARITPCLENGKTAYVSILDEDEVGFGSTEYIVFRNIEGVTDSKYIYYFVTNPWFRNIAIKSMVGSSGRQRVQLAVLENLVVNLPPLAEQKRIADILGALDDKIELNRRINDNLEEQAKALFKSWFVDNQDNDWKKIRLEEILEIGKTSIIPAQSPDTIFEHYSLPAFDNGTRPAYEKGCAIKSSKFYIQKNMFLFSKLNPRIKRIWFPNIQTEKAICSTEFIPYKPKDASLLGFCYSIVNSEAFYEYVLSLTNGSTGSHQRFHPTATLDYSLKIPDKDIIKKFESIVRPLYELIAKNRTENERLASLRDTLLPKLMSGEISVEEVSLD